LTWVPGHASIPGNKKADTNACEAAAGESFPPDRLPPIFRKTLPLSLSAAKSRQKTLMFEEWQKVWSASPRFHRLQHFD
ncbi:hypothetical protein M413DRAFT_35774, partial [Hebeloma cylindrosporum]